MEKKKKKKRHPVTLVILIIALAVMIFSIVKLAGIQKDYKESEKTFQTLESEYVVHPDGAGALWQDGTRIQFEALRKENPDIMAWLRFDNYNDVHISYPVLYSGDDETYLRSDIYGNYHIAGCIFLEGMNQPDFSDYHSIIYGHNMRNTTMFGDLKMTKGFMKITSILIFIRTRRCYGIRFFPTMTWSRTMRSTPLVMDRMIPGRL